MTKGPKDPRDIEAAKRAAAAAAELRRRQLRTCFAAEDPTSKPTAMQDNILRGIRDVLVRVVRSGNQSGKSATAARDLTWFIERTHPHINVNGEYGDGPLLILMCGQDRNQMDINIWQRLVKPLLSSSADWKEVRNGGQLVSATNRKTGDTILFLSHNHGSADDIKHLQSYAAHYVWIDEMPKNPAVLEELTRRIDAKRGRLIMTFTQKVRNEAIRRAIDNLDPSISKLYRLNKLDNPLYADRIEEELAKINHLSPAEQAAILYGDWIEGTNKVYRVARELHMGRPAGYNPAWPHVVSVDPATESKLGLTVWANCPETKVWWCVQASYVDGLYVPTRIIQEVENRLKGLNVIRRLYDNAEAWYAHQARAMGYNYLPVIDKSNNKQAWIAKLQEQLGRELMIAEWCEDLWAELESCERSETNPDKIANSSRFHLLDSVHYFLAMTPVIEVQKSYSSWDQWVYESNEQRKVDERDHRAQQARQFMKNLRTRPRSWR